MIVNSGRKYIIENGFNPTSENISVYFDNNTSSVTPEETTIPETKYKGTLVGIESSEDNDKLPPLSYLITARTSDDTPSDDTPGYISSMYITVAETVDGTAVETLLSRVVFPTQIVNGSSNTLTIQYHMYF